MPSAIHDQLRLREYGFGASASRGVPVCSSAFAVARFVYVGGPTDNQAKLTWVAD